MMMIIDWLISRRHCKKDYQKSVDTIRNKIRLAIQDMPQIDEVRELLQRNGKFFFNSIFFFCKKSSDHFSIISIRLLCLPTYN